MLSVSSDPTNILYQYGPLGIACVAEAAVIYKLWRALQNKDEKIAALNEDRVQRERDLSANELPAMTEMARVLASVPPAIEHSLAQAQDSIRSEKLDRLIERLEK